LLHTAFAPGHGLAISLSSQTVPISKQKLSKKISTDINLHKFYHVKSIPSSEDQWADQAYAVSAKWEISLFSIGKI